MTHPVLRIDIVSDIVCPWCAIGYYRLRRALAELELEADLHWHSFQLNPHIPPGGKNLRSHLREKYADPNASNAAARQRMTDLGADVGFQFNYFEEMRTYNTLQVHQLMSWAATQDRQTQLAEELFARYFTQQQAMDEPEVLLDAATSVGLDRDAAASALVDPQLRTQIEQAKNDWVSLGINGVPAFIFARKFLLSGAQEVALFKQVLEQSLDAAQRSDSLS